MASDSSFISDEEDYVRIRRNPAPRVRYVPNPRQAYPHGAPVQFIPEPQHRTIIRSRSRSRRRSRSRSRQRESPAQANAAVPAPAPPQPIIINNRMYNDYSSDEDSSSSGRERRRRHGRQVIRRRRSSSLSREASRERSRVRADWEAEQTRKQLEELRMVHARDEDKRRIAKKYQDEGDLRRAKQELDEIKAREAKAEEEKRIKKELEHKRLREEAEAAEQRALREKEAEEAVERYKHQEAERLAKEAKERELIEREYQRRLQEQLVHSGVDEKAIAAILKKEKVPESLPEPAPPAAQQALARPTYTRMSRKHLSMETLRYYELDWDLDSTDPEFVLIKRWVPEWEQDQLWKHTRNIRHKRDKSEEKHHRHKEEKFEIVRKKSHSRRRSKSPGLLEFFAGGVRR